MPRTLKKQKRSLAERFPPSEPCDCKVCLAYCARPGWWTVAEAERAIRAGLAPRMMLEISPDRSFGVLSPAFKGCEGSLALEEFAYAGCTFLKAHACELHSMPYMPLECRFCHHTRPGQGVICHSAIERDWNTPAGQALVKEWNRLTGLTQRLTRIRR